MLCAAKLSDCTVGLKASSVTGVKSLNPASDDDMMAALQQQPLSIAIEADQDIFQHYASGVITGSCGANLDHRVLFVGYGTDGSDAYWKVKNSWGASWGEAGYVCLIRGKNQCGINSQPTYPVFAESLSV